MADNLCESEKTFIECLQRFPVGFYIAVDLKVNIQKKIDIWVSFLTSIFLFWILACVENSFMFFLYNEIFWDIFFFLT